MNFWRNLRQYGWLYAIEGLLGKPPHRLVCDTVADAVDWLWHQ